MNSDLSRTRLLLGDDATERLCATRVIVFGVGGVGSWCVEALVRSGVRHITIVDPDRVCPSNINRQLMATTSTVGKPKVEVLRDRLLDISPEAEVDARFMAFSADTATEFNLNDYDYVVDAIDSIADKMLLIRTACRSKATLLSSMGAARKLDPSRIKVTEFGKWRAVRLPASCVRSLNVRATSLHASSDASTATSFCPTRARQTRRAPTAQCST